MKKLKHLLGVFVLIMVAILSVPNSINAAEMSDEFKSYLNDNGEFIVNAAKGTTEEDLALYLDFKYTNSELPYDIQWRNISKDLNTFDFTIYANEENEETHTVKIKYNYDKKVNEVINNYLNTTLKNKTKFNVSDLELVSYWLSNTSDNNNSLALYSGELKRLLDYKNIQLFTDSRMGGYDPFITHNGGFASFQSNGISYKVSPVLRGYAEHVIYIDENVGNTKEEVIAAVQKRIDDYFGSGKVTIEFAGEGLLKAYTDEIDWEIEFYKGQQELWTQEYERYKNDYDTNCSNIQAENEEMCNQLKGFKENALKELNYNNYPEKIKDAEEYKAYFIERWNSPNSEHNFLKDAYNDWYFWAHMELGDLMFSPFFVVKKDSSKMVEPFVKTVDSVTNVEISTNATLPLDTTIQAKELTSGTEYERILEILKLTDNVTFDLKLYSNSTDKYITKLEDGTFEVKIPIPKNFKRKDLAVYYVNEEGEKEPYTVDTTKEPEYAIFTTNHFSIYTLGYKGSASSEENPKTFDGIGNSIFMIITSTIGLILATIYLQKRKNKKIIL